MEALSPVIRNVPLLEKKWINLEVNEKKKTELQNTIAMSVPQEGGRVPLQ